MFQQRSGQVFLEKLVAEEAQAISCALSLGGSSFALFGKEETDVVDPQWRRISQALGRGG